MYSDHMTLLKQFRKNEAKVKDGAVTNLPRLPSNCLRVAEATGERAAPDTYAIGTVRETKMLNGKTRQTVQLTHENNWLDFELDYNPETGEWHFHPSLSDKLNELNVKPECNGGKVTLEERYDRETNKYVALTEEQLDYLGLSDGDVGSVEEHPEGSGRGGYVPMLDAGPYYCEGSGEWQD